MPNRQKRKFVDDYMEQRKFKRGKGRQSADSIVNSGTNNNNENNEAWDRSQRSYKGHKGHRYSRTKETICHRLGVGNLKMGVESLRGYWKEASAYRSPPLGRGEVHETLPKWYRLLTIPQYQHRTAHTQYNRLKTISQKQFIKHLKLQTSKSLQHASLGITR